MRQMVWIVNIIEYERGWGQRLDESVYFKVEDYEKAHKFVVQYNSKNNLAKVPDWYMSADAPVSRTIDYPVKFR